MRLPLVNRKPLLLTLGLSLAILWPGALASARIVDAPKRPCGRVLFLANNGTDSALKSVRGSGGDIRQVALGEPYGYEVSPDGVWIAYEKYSEPDNTNDLWLMRSDGSGARALTDTSSVYESEIDWAPDSRTLAFSAENELGTRIKTLDVETLKSTDVTEGYAPDFSPDGSEIAFVSESVDPGDLTSDVFVVTLASGEIRRITQSVDSHDQTPQWSPTGRWIAFNRYPLGQMNENEGPFSDLWRVRPDGADPKNVTNIQSDYVGVSPASWSPNGRLIAFNTEYDSGGVVQIIHSDGREKTKGLSDGMDRPSRNATWSRLGNHLAFERFNFNNSTVDIVRYTLSDGSKRNLTKTEKQGEFEPTWVICT